MSDQRGSDITAYDTPAIDNAAQEIAQGTPVVKGGYKLANDIIAAVEGDDPLKAAGSITADIGLMAFDAAMALRDPIGALANAGLTIVLELVQPLNDLLEMVSGDPDAMGQQQEVWGNVSSALEALSQETGGAVGAGMPGWQGDAATAAREQLAALEAAILACSHEAARVQTVLGWAMALAEAIYAAVKGILGELVAWLITRGLIALANSAWTFGASVATFLLTGAVKGFQLFMKGMKHFTNCCAIFKKIEPILMKLFGTDTFRGLAGAAGGFGQIAGGALWKGVLKNIGVKAGIGLGTGGLGSAAGALTTDGPAGTPNASGGPVHVELEEFTALAGSLDGLAGNAGGIHGVASEAAAVQMAWGLPGALGFESGYQDSCNGLSEAISDVQGALEGDATLLRATGEDYRSADEEAATELNALLAEFGK